MKKLVMFSGMASFLLISLFGCGQSNKGENAETISDTMLAMQQQAIAQNMARKTMEDQDKPITSIPEGVSVTDDSIEIKNGKVTVVDFGATWCGPCNMMHPLFESAEQEYGKDLNFVSIDVDQYPSLSSKYDITNIPCFVVLDSNGKELKRKIGGMSESEFMSFIKSNLK